MGEMTALSAMVAKGLRRRATHVDHGGVQGPDHDEVGQRSQAECGKSNEG